jgi:disulfide bond formation protein DsbB
MTQRLAYLLCFLTIAGILGTGVYLEVVEGIMPCPLCTLQRICFAACGCLFLIGVFLHRYRVATLIINFLALVFSGLGIFFAGRQIWIQAFHSNSASECGASISYMLTVLPLSDVAQKIFSGSTECSQRGWELLGLNIPEWSLFFFILFFGTSLYYLFRGNKHQTRY